MVATEKGHSPTLRFPEFRGAWAQKCIDDIASVKGGKRIPKGYSLQEENNGYPYITVSDMEDGTVCLKNIRYVPCEVQQSIARYIINTSDIFISVAGTLGIVGIIPPELDGANLTENADRLTDLKCNREYLLQFLKSGRLQKLIESVKTTNAQPKLAIAAIKKFELGLPEEFEQQKIAAFLGAVDDKLTVLRRKRELLQDYKRGMMQKIFSQELRFKREDGSDFPDWEEKRLEDIAQRSKIKNTDCSITRVLTNSATQGVVDQQTYFDKDIANADNLGGYYIVEKGDYVYNPRISVHAPVGPIKKNQIGKGIMSPLYTVFRFNVSVDEFFEQYFRTNFWHKYMCCVANYGARHDRMNITTKDFMDMTLPWPHPDEQRKIVDFLAALDVKLVSANKQVEMVETFKKGLLQKMFV